MIAGNTIAIADAATFELIQRVGLDGLSEEDRKHFGELWWLAWSPDGTRVAAGGDDGGFGVWNATTANRVACSTGRQGATAGAWVDDATLAIGFLDGKLVLLDAATFAIRLIAPRPLHDRVLDIVRRRDGPLYVVTNGKLAAFDPVTLEENWQVAQLRGLVDAALDPTGERIALTRKTGEPISIHSAVDGALITEVPVTKNTWQARWSPEGTVLWTAGFDQRVLALDGETYELIESFGGSEGQVWTVSALDERTAVTGGVDGVLRIWRIGSMPSRSSIKLSQDKLKRSAFSGDGQLVVIVDGREVMYCVDLSSMTLRWTVQSGAQVVGMRVVDGLGLLAIASDGSLRRIDMGSGTVIEQVDTGIWCSRAVFAHDGAAIYFERGGEVGCVARESGRRQWSARTTTEGIESMAISPDGSLIATGAFNQSVELFDARTGRATLCSNPGYGDRRVHFSHDSQAVWSCTQQSAHEAICHDVKTGETTKCYGGAPTSGTDLTVALHAPRGAIRAIDGEIRVFGTDSENPPGLLAFKETGVLTRPAFAPWADRLLLLRADGVLEVLDGTPLNGASGAAKAKPHGDAK